MKKWIIPPYYPALLIGVVILLLVGGCITTTTSSQTTEIPTSILSSPTMTTTQSSSPAESLPGSTQDPGPVCNSDLQIIAPVDASIPIQDPMPGIRYSFNRSETGRTIVLEKGDIVEVTLGFAPSLAMRWIVPVGGCGIELVNDGTYYTGGDFWNNTGYYRARYRAIRPGTSVLNGKLVIRPDDPGGLRFNLTVIVK
jgi:hypothetical protein